MKLTEISLNWILPGALLLLGAITAVTLMARGRKAVDSAQGGDSWERTAERRRRKERAYATASYSLLFCCAAVAAALSFRGLVGFGQENLGLSGGWEYLVPFGLDGAAMFSAVIAVREASHGDASVGSRLLVWVFAGAAAWFNWVHAPRGVGHAGAPQFFAGMSLSAAILFDRALKQTRKTALREQGLVPKPLPQIRVIRWLRAPRETYGAWSLMLLEGVGSLEEAVDEVREERRRKNEEHQRKREQAKLERARLRALRGHALPGMRGRHARRLELTAAAQSAAAGQQVEVEREPAAAEPAPAEAGVPVRPRAALAAAGDDRDRRGRRGRQDAADPGAEESGDQENPASPRLDSLEEKLAAIERQFG